MSFPRYPKYKDSGVEWLGEVPEHWRVDRLKHLAVVYPSNVDKKIYDNEISVRLCNYTDVYYHDRIVDSMSFMEATASEEQIEKFTLEAGDVIITKDSETADDIARSTYVPNQIPGVVCGYHPALIRTNEGACGGYVKSVFDSTFMRAQVEVRANGLTRVGLSQYAIDNLLLPVPSLEEQSTITRFLDAETAKIDALVEEQRRLIELLKEKRQAVISHAVTKGLDPNFPKKDSRVQWMGEIPSHWRVFPLSRITLERCDGPFGSGLKSDHYTEKGVRVVRLQNIRSEGFLNADSAFIDPAYYDEELTKHSVRRGDVLIAGLGDERNTVGRACVAPDYIEPAMVKADCFRFRLNTAEASPEFIAAQLSAGSAMDAGVLSTGSTRSRIPLSVMGSRKVAIPSREEQDKISSFIRRTVDELQVLNDSAQIIVKLLEERRSALISAAVTGKIDVRSLVPKEAA